MMTIYPQAKEAWYDYYNNGFKLISEGTFMQDFISFFRKYISYTDHFFDFYQENFPHFTIIQMKKYHKNLTEPEFNSFFESSPSKNQKDFIDFCYISIEEHKFGEYSLWIMPEDEMPPLEDVEPTNVWKPQHNQDAKLYVQELISSDEDSDDEMPALETDEDDYEIVN